MGQFKNRNEKFCRESSQFERDRYMKNPYHQKYVCISCADQMKEYYRRIRWQRDVFIFCSEKCLKYYVSEAPKWFRGIFLEDEGR